MEPLYTFGEILDYLRQGYQVARLGWQDVYIFLVNYYGSEGSRGYYLPGVEYRVENHLTNRRIQPSFVIASKETLQPWVLSPDNVLAADWRIVGRQVSPRFFDEPTGVAGPGDVGAEPTT
jgi:hypothetical protein